LTDSSSLLGVPAVERAEAEIAAFIGLAVTVEST
jgi:hypothetical protein